MNACTTCGASENLQVHHISYEPKETQVLCQKCHAKLHNISPNLAEAKVQYENLKDLEKVRVGIENRIRGLKGWGINTELLNEEVKTIKKLERNAGKALVGAVSDKKIFGWLIGIRGIADKSAAELIALIGDIDRFNKISSLWHYAGLHVDNGKAPKPMKGKQITYYPKLKTLCIGIFGKNLIRSKSPYRKFYDEKKKYYEENRDWTKLHRHNAAIRYMVKMFIKDLWLKWRELEGLPITEPHPQDQPIRNMATIYKVCHPVDVGDKASGSDHEILVFHIKGNPPAGAIIFKFARNNLSFTI